MSISQTQSKQYTADKKLGQGTYGAVYRVTTPSKTVAAAKIFNEEVYREGSLNPSTLRELVLTKSLESHPNIVQIKDVEYSKGEVKMIMPLADGSLKNLIAENDSSMSEERSFKIMAYEIIKAVAYCTSRNIVNRDIKPDNILYTLCKDEPPRMILADFGIGRPNVCVVTGFTKDMYTLNYRAPEVLLGTKYDEKAEVWAVACVIAEMTLGSVFLNGRSERDQLNKIFEMFGTPSELTWPGVESLPRWRNPSPLKSKFTSSSIKTVAPVLYDLLEHAFILDPTKRSTIFQMQSHEYFDSIRDAVDKSSKCYAVPPARANSCMGRLDLNDFGYEGPDPSTNLDGVIYSQARITVFEWLLELRMTLKLGFSTLFLATCLFDAYSSKNPPAKKDIQTIGSATLKIASDLYEKELLDVGNLIRYSRRAFEFQDIAAAEIDILEKLDYQLLRSTSYDYVVALGVFYSEEEGKLARACVVATLRTLLPFTYTSLEIATACVLIATVYMGSTFRNESLLNDRVTECALRILSAISMRKLVPETEFFREIERFDVNKLKTVNSKIDSGDIIVI